MQHTTLSGSSATGRTGDGGDLFEGEFVLFHPDRLQLHTARNLYNSGHPRGLRHVNANTPGRVRLRRGGVVVPCDDDPWVEPKKRPSQAAQRYGF